jgi:hypothetical protein
MRYTVQALLDHNRRRVPSKTYSRLCLLGPAQKGIKRMIKFGVIEEAGTASVSEACRGNNKQ